MMKHIEVDIQTYIYQYKPTPAHLHYQLYQIVDNEPRNKLRYQMHLQYEYYNQLQTCYPTHIQRSCHLLSVN